MTTIHTIEKIVSLSKKYNVVSISLLISKGEIPRLVFEVDDGGADDEEEEDAEEGGVLLGLVGLVGVVGLTVTYTLVRGMFVGSLR